MHIVYVTKIYLPHIGGVELYIKNLADYFIAAGHSVTVLTADKEVQRRSETYSNGVHIIRLPVVTIQGVFFLKQRNDRITIKQILAVADIVHVNDCKFLFAFFAQQKNHFHYKLVCSSHGWLFHSEKHQRIKKLYFRYVVSRNALAYDHIICVSERDKHIADTYDLKKTVVILPGADYKKYADLPTKAEQGYTFFYWGRISPNKGILEALQKISSLTTNWHVIIAGTSDDSIYMKRLQTYIAEHALEKRITFLGMLSDSDIRRQMSMCDFILMPSLHEGFGVTLVECLCSNRPILVNRIDAFETILKQTEATEYLFDFVSNDSNLQQKIDTLQKKKIVPKHVEQFSFENLTRNIENLYSNLLV